MHPQKHHCPGTHRISDSGNGTPAVSGYQSCPGIEQLRKHIVAGAVKILDGHGLYPGIKEGADDFVWRGSVGLFVGGVGPGLSDEVIARCSARVTIPMARGVESLNVAVATGVLIYAARRQRMNP